MDLLIRFAKMEDAEELLALYTPYVTDTVITFEYEVPSLEEFKDRMRQTMKKYPYLVAEQNGEILGYSCAGAFKGRAAYDWAVETSIYVKHDVEGEVFRQNTFEKFQAEKCNKKAV